MGRPKNMHNLIERIVKGIKCVSTDENTPIIEFDISDDAVEAWTQLYGEPPNQESFSKFINTVLTKYLDAKKTR